MMATTIARFQWELPQQSSCWNFVMAVAIIKPSDAPIRQWKEFDDMCIHVNPLVYSVLLKGRYKKLDVRKCHSIFK